MGDMMRLLAVLVIFALSSICLANLANDVTPCGDVTRPIEIYVEGCPAVPCTVRNGTSVQFRFTWIPGSFSIYPIVEEFQKFLPCSRGFL